MVTHSWQDNPGFLTCKLKGFAHERRTRREDDERVIEGREDDERLGLGEEQTVAHAWEEAEESWEEKRGGGGRGGGRGPTAAGRRPGRWRRR
jgi:hypothetical protein